MQRYTFHSYKNVDFLHLQSSLQREVIEVEGTDEDMKNTIKDISSKGYKILAWVENEIKEQKEHAV